MISCIICHNRLYEEFILKNTHNVSGQRILILFIIALVVAVLLAGVKSLREADKYKKLTAMPNPACLGLGKASAHGISLSPVSLEAKSFLHQDEGKVAAFTCHIGISTQAATIHGKFIDSYPLGAEVTYFENNQTAMDYADKQVNPLRYWGFFDANPDGEIRQDDSFTFVVTDVTPMILDAYTVKDNALIRISLPCDSTKECFGTGTGSGTQTADLLLKDFADSLQPLNL